MSPLRDNLIPVQSAEMDWHSGLENSIKQSPQGRKTKTPKASRGIFPYVNNFIFIPGRLPPRVEVISVLM